MTTTELAGAPVLVVEDDPDIREVYRRVLVKLGCEVRLADSGAAAFALVAGGFAPRVAYVDLGLPDLCGGEVIARLRAMGLAASCSFVVASGSGDDSAVLADADAVMAKPFGVAALRALTRTLATKP
ncbi:MULTISPECIES: response regulator [Actinosynnema]|uniref:response regulator n=1 Tax=Actinosynnema TaxID=40566 RepID=UPI0020A2DD4A|nr:response regulator [Actinosynnema pretiosum]MCP2099545.1 Response regulator receiver domain-containing protein [Actinosynnema pretiosum]